MPVSYTHLDVYKRQVIQCCVVTQHTFNIDRWKKYITIKKYNFLYFILSFLFYFVIIMLLGIKLLSGVKKIVKQGKLLFR